MEFKESNSIVSQTQETKMGKQQEWNAPEAERFSIEELTLNSPVDGCDARTGA